jgi:serine phosphatase RsbU (regulator of sigma subunit)
VGGDFFQFAPIDGGGLLVLVGDVSGKGLRAAMLVSLIVGAFRNRHSDQPGEILGELNAVLAGQMDGGFVTACCARFELSSGLAIANAGHPAPYCDAREAEVEAGLPLGLVRDASYQESVAPGNRFTFVSDGVVEAENAQRQIFGFDRTREISTRPAAEVAEAARAWGQNDDITVVTVRRVR